MAKRYNGGRKGGRGRSYQSRGYNNRPQRRVSRGNRGGGRSYSSGRPVINLTLQAPPQFYTGANLPGAAAPVGFGPGGMMIGQPNTAPRKSRF